MRLLSRARRAGPRLRVFVAADIHGSDVCFRKFVNAGRFYGADAVVLGGDITGKALVPVVLEAGERFRIRFMGADHVVGPDEIDEIERLIRFNGFYPYRCEPEELEAMRSDAQAIGGAFDSAMRRQVRDWIHLADERLAGSGIACFVMPGNDDGAFVPELLMEAGVVQNHDSRVHPVDGLRILGYGWSNPTPWNTPRERSEEEIEADLRALFETAGDPATLIFNPHVPPYGTGVDLAPELRADLSMVMRSGQPNMIPVGSTAVRKVIEDYQPLLALTGHIHESRGVTRLGRTVVVNPGSEYNSGRLLGALIDIEGRRIANTQLLTG